MINKRSKHHIFNYGKKTENTLFLHTVPVKISWERNQEAQSHQFWRKIQMYKNKRIIPIVWNWHQQKSTKCCSPSRLQYKPNIWNSCIAWLDNVLILWLFMVGKILLFLTRVKYCLVQVDLIAPHFNYKNLLV